MAKINARDWIFEVSLDPDAVTPVWAAIGGLKSFDLNAAENEESVDTTDFESGGVSESQPMQRGASIQLEGDIKRAATSPFAQDAGQAAAESLAEEVGEAGLGGLRFRHTTDTDWTVWSAWVSLGSKGGGVNDKTSWAANFTRSGAASTDAVA